MSINFPANPVLNDIYTVNGRSWIWNGKAWQLNTPIGPTGYTGSQGIQGTLGYSGSKGDQGIQGNVGYTGSQGITGYIGSIGDTGYTGSKGDPGGYTGSQGAPGAGYTGSQGDIGYTGSKGDIGYTGSNGVLISNRTTTTVYTGTISNDASASVSITGFKGYLLYKIATSAAAWVRVYTDQAARTSDSSRSITTDPSANSGLVAEVITTGNQTVRLTPGAVGFNDEATPTTSIPLAVTNKSGASANISVTLTIVKYED